MSSSPWPRNILDRGVTIMDIAKYLIDRGIHHHGSFPDSRCLMIEPTETESKATLDNFCEVMLQIAEQSEKDIRPLKEAPITTPFAALTKSVPPENPSSPGPPAPFRHGPWSSSSIPGANLQRFPRIGGPALHPAR